jgi:ribosomal protein S17
MREVTYVQDDSDDGEKVDTGRQSLRHRLVTQTLHAKLFKAVFERFQAHPGDRVTVSVCRKMSPEH